MFYDQSDDIVDEYLGLYWRGLRHFFFLLFPPQDDIQYIEIGLPLFLQGPTGDGGRFASGVGGVIMMGMGATRQAGCAR